MECTDAKFAEKYLKINWSWNNTSFWLTMTFNVRENMEKTCSTWLESMTMIDCEAHFWPRSWKDSSIPLWRSYWDLMVRWKLTNFDMVCRWLTMLIFTIADQEKGFIWRNWISFTTLLYQTNMCNLISNKSEGSNLRTNILCWPDLISQSTSIKKASLIRWLNW